MRVSKKKLERILASDYDDNIEYKDYLPSRYTPMPKEYSGVKKYSRLGGATRMAKDVGVGLTGGAIIGAMAGARRAEKIDRNPFDRETLKKNVLPRVIAGAGIGGALGVVSAKDTNGLYKTESILSHANKNEVEAINNLSNKIEQDRSRAYGMLEDFHNRHRRAIENYSDSQVEKQLEHLNNICTDLEKNHPDAKRLESLKNRATYNALKKYYKVAASEELDTMYKQALLGGVGDGVAIGSIIGGITKNYQTGGGGMTGTARIKGGMGNVTKNLGKTIAKGAMLGAAAQAGATALDNMTRPADEDEYGRRVTASEVLDEMYKEAAENNISNLDRMYGAVSGELGEPIYIPSEKKKKENRKNIRLGTLIGAAGGAGVGSYIGKNLSNKKRGIVGGTALGALIGAVEGSSIAGIRNNIKDKDRTDAILNYYKELQESDPEAWK